MTNNGSTTTTTDYAAGFVYTDNNLQFAGIEEGRMLYNDQSGAFDREGFLLDHLGNLRVVFADNNSDGVAEVVQENHYYPFGLSMGALNYTNTLENKFKYNLPAGRRKSLRAPIQINGKLVKRRTERSELTNTIKN